MVFVIAFMVFIAVAVSGYAIATLLQTRESAEERIRDRLQRVGAGGSGRRQSPLLKDQRLSSIGVLDAFLSRLSITRSLAQLTRQAGLRNRVGEVFLYIILMTSVAVLLGLLTTGSFMMAHAWAAGAAFIPVLVLRRRRRKRMALFSEQLPDSLDLIRAALQLSLIHISEPTRPY